MGPGCKQGSLPGCKAYMCHICDDSFSYCALSTFSCALSTGSGKGCVVAACVNNGPETTSADTCIRRRNFSLRSLVRAYLTAYHQDERLRSWNGRDAGDVVLRWWVSLWSLPPCLILHLTWTYQHIFTPSAANPRVSWITNPIRAVLRCHPEERRRAAGVRARGRRVLLDLQ